jgi:hypothetical protein
MTPGLLERLEEAGLNSVETLAEGGRDALLAIDGVEEETADALVAWATEQQQRVAQEIGQAFRRPEAASSSSMGDEDFMAALSRAFQESEQARAHKAESDEEDEASAAAEVAKAAEAEAGDGEPREE